MSKELNIFHQKELLEARLNAYKALITNDSLQPIVKSQMRAMAAVTKAELEALHKIFKQEARFHRYRKWNEAHDTKDTQD
jgi:hypothetical protein